MAFNVGLTMIFPAVAASYQITVSPGSTVAVAVSVCIGEASHWVISPPETGAVGAASIVKVTAVLVNDAQFALFASA